MEKRDVSMSELAQMAEGARMEEFGVDLHELRKRALNRLPPLEGGIKLELSEEEQREISRLTGRYQDEELLQMGEGAREEEFGVDLHELRKRALNRLPPLEGGIKLELSEEEAREIDQMVHSSAQ